MSIKYKISIECPIERRHITNGEIVICQNDVIKRENFGHKIILQ